MKKIYLQHGGGVMLISVMSVRLMYNVYYSCASKPSVEICIRDTRDRLWS